jgi:hypothetical protein
MIYQVFVDGHTGRQQVMRYKKWLYCGMIGLIMAGFAATAQAWSEEQVDSVAAALGGAGYHDHSTFHYDLSRLLAWQAGYPLEDAETLARYCALVDQMNPKPGYPNPGALNPITSPDSFPEWPQGLAGTERGSNARNEHNETPGVYWHFPYRNPADPVAGGFVYGTRYPVLPPPDSAHTLNPYYWRLTQTAPPDYMTAMQQWAFTSQGIPGLPELIAADTVMYFDEREQRYLPVPPGSLIALGIFIHCLADCYSHEECMIQDTVRSHPLATPCGGTYHYQELPYATSDYARPHADAAAKAVWRSLRAYSVQNSLGYAPRWTADQNGFEDGDGVPDELEDNGNLNHTESFIERWKSPALFDLNGDGTVNHFDHTIHRIELASGLFPEAVPVSSPALPAIFTLDQNYPNPFNPETRLRFTLHQAGYTDLSIYNLQGQWITTLVRGLLEAGPHELLFDGRHLPSAVYVCRLESAGLVSHRKMLLLR